MIGPMFRLIALCAAGALCLIEPALAQQTTPCVGCAIARQESAAQVRANQAIVQNALQNSMNAQLQSQANALETQALLRSLQLNGAMTAGSLELRQLLLQQQIILTQIRQREAAKARRRPAKPVHF